MAVVPYTPNSLLPMFHEARRTFTFGNQTIEIQQDWANAGVAGVVWDAAIVLATFLQTINDQGAYGLSKIGLAGDTLKGKKVIELGAGTGLVGIVSSFLGADVVITDTSEALNFTLENVNKNIDCSNSSCNCKVEVLHWGKDLEKWTDKSWDIILGADIVYVKDTFPQLLETLVKLTETNKSTCVLLSCRIRYQRDIDFIELLKTEFNVVEILFDEERDVKLFKAKRTT